MSTTKSFAQVHSGRFFSAANVTQEYGSWSLQLFKDIQVEFPFQRTFKYVQCPFFEVWIAVCWIPSMYTLGTHLPDHLKVEDGLKHNDNTEVSVMFCLLRDQGLHHHDLH